jgi:hypothetical protein
MGVFLDRVSRGFVATITHDYRDRGQVRSPAKDGLSQVTKEKRFMTIKSRSRTRLGKADRHEELGLDPASLTPARG